MKQYTQLQEWERERIYEGIKQGLTQSSIAKKLERDKSTITRELQRNSDRFGYLYPKDAQKKTKDRKAKHGSKIDRNTDLKKYVIDKLKEGWSPEVIAGRWKKEHPKSSITPEAINLFINQKIKNLNCGSFY